MFTFLVLVVLRLSAPPSNHRPLSLLVHQSLKSRRSSSVVRLISPDAT